MGLPWRFRWIVPMLTLAGIVFIHATVLLASVRPAKEKAAEKQVAPETPAPSDKGKSARSSKARPDKPYNPESKPKFSKEAEQGKGTDRGGHKARRQRPKKLPPKAIVQSKPDLSYMGKFQTPQRYHPSRDSRDGGPLNPRAGDVLHDHFQELDHNRDGVIDPLERASGRLDIDRDLANRKWQ